MPYTFFYLKRAKVLRSQLLVGFFSKRAETIGTESDIRQNPLPPSECLASDDLQSPSFSPRRGAGEILVRPECGLWSAAAAPLIAILWFGCHNGLAGVGLVHTML